jgi:hypothetical protein
VRPTDARKLTGHGSLLDSAKGQNALPPPIPLRERKAAVEARQEVRAAAFARSSKLILRSSQMRMLGGARAFSQRALRQEVGDQALETIDHPGQPG